MGMELIVREVPFREDTVLMTTEQDGEAWVPLKRLCENLGLGLTRQIQKVESDPRFSCIHKYTTAPDGKNYEMFCLPISQVHTWLFSINANKVRADLRDKVIQYQRECARVLDAYWRKGFEAENQEMRARILALEGNISVRLSAVERQLGRRKHTSRTYAPSPRLTPEEVSEIQVASNQLMAKCAPLPVIQYGERIPEHLLFFILQRSGYKPHIYARIEKVRLGLVAMGHRWSTKRLSAAYKELGHQPEQFKWARQNIRGWAMEMAAIAGGVPDMIPLSLN